MFGGGGELEISVLFHFEEKISHENQNSNKFQPISLSFNSTKSNAFSLLCAAQINQVSW